MWFPEIGGRQSATKKSGSRFRGFRSAFVGLAGLALALSSAVGLSSAAAASTAAPTPTIKASCVSEYNLDPSVGVTTIAYSSAPTGAQIKIIGYVTEYRDVTPGDGSVVLPGLPLSDAGLAVDQITLVDSAGVTLAGPVGLALCVTPPVDLCTNIEGNQSTMPAGYEDPDGDKVCTQIPPPPVDLCTNIEGNQSTMPAGYEDPDGDKVCTKTPTKPGRSGGSGLGPDRDDTGFPVGLLGGVVLAGGMLLLIGRGRRRREASES